MSLEQAIDEDAILKPGQMAKSRLTDSGYWQIRKKKDKEKKKRDKNLATNQNKTQDVFKPSLRIESDKQITDNN